MVVNNDAKRVMNRDTYGSRISLQHKERIQKLSSSAFTTTTTGANLSVLATSLVTIRASAIV